MSLMVIGLAGCDLLQNAKFMERFQTRPQPQDSIPFSEQGIGKLAKGDLLQAQALFDRALQSNPRDVHALLGKGLVYQQTGQLTQAQAAYEAVISLRPANTQKLIVLNNLQPQSVLELANLNLALLQNRGLSSSLAGNQQQRGGQAPQPMVAPNQPRPAVMQRGTTPELVNRLAGPTAASMVSEGDKNVIERFETLKKLLDEGLLTQAEYSARRKVNLGALLYLTQPPPAAGLERSVPDEAQIMQRLNAIRRALELRAITNRQHSAERTAIVEGLMPANPRYKANPRPAPKGLLASADAIRRTEMLQERGLVTAAEAAAEKAAIEKALQPPKPPPAPKAAAPAPKAAAPAPAQAASAAKSQPKPAAIPAGPQPAVHIASFRSQKDADRVWAQLRRAHRSLFANLKPEITRVNLGRGKGVFYRLVVGPLRTQADVQRVCRQLKSRRQYCEPAFMAGG